MAEDGEDWNELELTILKSVAIIYKIHERWHSSFKLQVTINYPNDSTMEHKNYKTIMYIL